MHELPCDGSNHRMIGAAQAAELCNVSLAHWRRLYRSGSTPAPIRIGLRKLGWIESDLVAWITTRAEPQNDNATRCRRTLDLWAS